MNRKSFFGSLALAAVLMTAAWPAAGTYAAYTPGQSISIQKVTLSPAPVEIKFANLTAINPGVWNVETFGLAYKVDVSNAKFVNAQGATITSQSFSIGAHVGISGGLDVADPTLIHAQIVRAGTAGAGPFNQGTGPCASGALYGNSPGIQTVAGEAVLNLVRMAINCPTPWVLKGPQPGDMTSGSPNQKLVSRVWYYAWAMKAGTAAQKTESKKLLLEFFTTGESQGHYFFGANEVFPISHYEVWYTGMAGARFFAWLYKDADLMAASGKWWREEMALDKLLLRDGTIDTPGTRFGPGQPTTNQLRDVIYLMIAKLNLPSNPGAGGNLPGSPGAPDSPWWSDFYNSGPWIIRNLLRLGDDMGGSATASNADLPILHNTFCVYTKGADYVRWFPVLTDGLDRLNWVAKVNGVRSHGPYPAEQKNGADPNAGLPSLAGYTLFVVYGPNHSSADCTTPPGGGGSGDGGGSGGSGGTPTSTPSSTQSSSNALKLISELKDLRKNTKDAGFSKNPADKPKIFLNLLKIQKDIIDLSVAVAPFMTNTDTAKAMVQVQPMFMPFNLVAIACADPLSYIPFVHVNDACKRGLEKTGGDFSKVLDDLKASLPPPPPGEPGGDDGGGGGGPGRPTGPFDI